MAVSEIAKRIQDVPTIRVLSDRGNVTIAEMSVNDWIHVNRHPRQRNTERHAKAKHWNLAKRATGAVKEHLAHVTAAYLDDKLYKVDGHTRAFLWETGQLPSPGKLLVTIYHVQSEDELNHLYLTFDGMSAALTSYDKIYGAYQQHGLVLSSKRLRSGFLVDALNIALRGATRSSQDRRLPELDLFKAVEAFKEELTLLDTANPQPEEYQSGVVAATLIGLSLYPTIIDFCQHLANREGYKKAGRMDPVESVLALVDKLKQERSSWARLQQEDLAGRTLRAILAWKEGDVKGNQYWFKTKIHAVDLQPLIKEMKMKKRIENDPDL